LFKVYYHVWTVRHTYYNRNNSWKPWRVVGLPFSSTWVHLRFLVGSVLLIFLVFWLLLRFINLFVFVLCLVCPMLSVSLDCLRSVSRVPNVVSVSGLSSFCVSCAQCCQRLWIVHSWCSILIFLQLMLTLMNYGFHELFLKSTYNFAQGSNVNKLSENYSQIICSLLSLKQVSHFLSQGKYIL
jgi:hypothetical protein